MKKTRQQAILIGAALSSLMLGHGQAQNAASGGHRATVSSVRGAAAAKQSDDKHACKGKNACKGKGGCKAGDNGCQGKNSCKGKGGCATDGSKTSR